MGGVAKIASIRDDFEASPTPSADGGKCSLVFCWCMCFARFCYCNTDGISQDRCCEISNFTQCTFLGKIWLASCEQLSPVHKERLIHLNKVEMNCFRSLVTRRCNVAADWAAPSRLVKTASPPPAQPMSYVICHMFLACFFHVMFLAVFTVLSKKPGFLLEFFQHNVVKFPISPNAHF